MSCTTRVLVADRYLLHRKALKYACEAHNDIRVVGVAGTPQETLQSSRWLKPDVVIVVDNLLDDNVELITGIRAMADPPSVLVVTPDRTPESLVRSLSAGAYGVVLSSLSAAELASGIRRAARGIYVIPSQLVSGMVQSFLTERAEDERGRELLTRLTPREREVLALLVEGHDNHTIAEQLFLSSQTVRSHVHSAMRKLETHSRVEAAAVAVRYRLVPRADAASKAELPAYAAVSAAGADLAGVR